MSSIVPISGASSLLSILNPQSADSSSNVSSTSSATPAASSSSSSGDNSSSNDTTTTTQTLADGSTLVIVSQGDTIISETKLPAPDSNSSKQGKVGSALVSNQFDKFNDSSASTATTAGSLFNSAI